MIPDSHPRSASLKTRHALIDGVKKSIVAESGLIAHGRGEAFDYLLGEKTHPFSIEAVRAAAALLFLADHPVICVNGNTAVLCPDEMIRFSNRSGIPLEINLFYRRPERYVAIENHLKAKGARKVLGADPEKFTELPGLESFRRVVDVDGVAKADVVVVPLEDGDRTEALVRLGKKVITIDLNPLSRTSLAADVTIVDNVLRVFPLLEETYFSMDKDEAQEIINKYDNKAILEQSLETLSHYWKNEFNKKYADAMKARISK